MQALAHGEQSHGGLTTRSTITKSITRNEDGETQITVEGSGSTQGGEVPMMNQTIMVEAKPLESVEAFGIKAESANIWWGVLAIVILMAMYKWVKK